ncbi:YobI family P-loop NTPase [Phascolarctobacterium sp.]
MDKYSEYKDLAPISNAENVEEYLNALKWALEQEKITNIALAGPYGSGKSSIIDTFLEKHKDESFFQTYTSENNSWIINKIKSCILQRDKVYRFNEISKKISMATFIEANSNKKCKNEAHENEDEDEAAKKICISADEVEKGILKQLFYTIDPKKIPQSRYRKLHPINFSNIITKVIVYFAIALIFIFIFYYEKMASIFSGISAVLSYVGVSLLSCVFVFVAFAVCIWAISKIVYDFSSKYSIKGIKLSSNVDIQKEEGVGESVFNKNLDEIIYFFETTEYRLIFFEDLDRLDDRTIFVHLRELNNLLNCNENIKGKVVFVYAVKDNIFTKEDRTKFFDFIIPVIPIINSTNSGEVLQKFLQEAKEHGIKHDISQNFVLDVSPYIADMRILRNIYNEFVVYKSILRAGQGVELKDEQMLAIIIYKNLCPSDFADIQNEKGLIKEALEAKRKYIDVQKNNLQEIINERSSKLDSYKKECLQSIREIKIAMMSGIMDNNGIVDKVNDFQAKEILEDSFDMNNIAKLSSARVYYFSFGYNYEQNKVMSDISGKIKPYLIRIDSVKNIHDIGCENLQNELEELNKQKRDISKKTLSYILKRGNDLKFDDIISDNKLLMFLLRRGYIDEKYANYINYFKGNTITKDDMNFILSVKNQEAKPWDYAITKTDMVIRRLQEYEFERKEIYNFDLLEQLLAGGNDNVKLELFFKQLADETKLSWDFIDEFTERTNHLAEFIKGLSRNWAGMWLFISNKNTISYERQVYYLCLLLANISADDVSQYNIDDCMEKYFEDHADILQKLQEKLGSEKIKNILLQLKPKFSELNIDGIKDKEILDAVFDNAMYEINLPMVKNVIKFKNSTLIDSFEAQPYSVVVRLNDSLISEYIQKNINKYVDDIILKQYSPADELEDILGLVEKLFEEDEDELIEKLIRHESFVVDDISRFLWDEIEGFKEDVHVVWKALLENERIVVSWENTVTYWKCYNFDDCLKKFIADNVYTLKEDDKKYCKDSFISELILCGMPISVYEVLLPVLRMSEFSISLTDIPKEILGIMVRCQYFAFTPEKFSEMKDIDESLAVEYISLNQDEAIENTNDLDIDSALLNEILTSANITISNKEQFLEVFGVTYMTAEIVMSINELKLKITKETFDVAWKVANHDDKLKLFFDHLSLFTADDFERYVSEIGGEYATLSDRTKRYKPVISWSENNSNLVEHLKEAGYITSYNVEKKANSKEKQIRCVIKRKS